MNPTYTKEIYKEKCDRLSALPEDLKNRISYGLYGSVPQYFINGVDGTCAQLGNNTLPPDDVLRKTVFYADKAHARLVKSHNQSK